MNDDNHDLINFRLEAIEERLSRIENAGEPGAELKPILTMRTVALVVLLTVFVLGIYLGLNYVFNHLLDVLPD